MGQLAPTATLPELRLKHGDLVERRIKIQINASFAWLDLVENTPRFKDEDLSLYIQRNIIVSLYPKTEVFISSETSMSLFAGH